jgi:hypothetical protein
MSFSCKTSELSWSTCIVSNELPSSLEKQHDYQMIAWSLHAVHLKISFCWYLVMITMFLAMILFSFRVISFEILCYHFLSLEKIFVMSHQLSFSWSFSLIRNEMTPLHRRPRRRKDKVVLFSWKQLKWSQGHVTLKSWRCTSIIVSCMTKARVIMNDNVM